MKNYENEKTSKLERRIEKAIEKECMKRGLMGNEGVSVTLQLTDEEKNEFLKTELNEKYDWWEFETNGKLTITIADLDNEDMKMAEERIEKLNGKSFTVSTKWVQENDSETYDCLHDMMEKFASDEDNQTQIKDLEDFEAGNWLVEYSFFEVDGEITIRIYAGKTTAAIANQPPWIEQYVTAQEFAENWPVAVFVKELEKN